MNCARNYENLLNFIKVMPKILLVPFFSGHGVYQHVNFIAYCLLVCLDENVTV